MTADLPKLPDELLAILSDLDDRGLVHSHAMCLIYDYGRLCRATAEQAGNYGHSAGCTSASADHPYSPVLSCCLGAEQAGKVEGLTEARMKLTRIQVAGCRCNTKTPEVQYHAEDCHYRLACEIDDLLAKPTQPAAPDDKPRMLTPEELADLHAKQRAIGPVSPIREVEALVVDDAMIRRFVDAVGTPYCFDMPPPGVIRTALTAALAPVQEKAP